MMFGVGLAETFVITCDREFLIARSHKLRSLGESQGRGDSYQLPIFFLHKTSIITIARIKPSIKCVAPIHL
jgi:hypothetical protein